MNVGSVRKYRELNCMIHSKLLQILAIAKFDVCTFDHCVQLSSLRAEGESRAGEETVRQLEVDQLRRQLQATSEVCVQAHTASTVL